MDNPNINSFLANAMRKNKLAGEMTHDRYKNPLGGVSENFAYGTYEAPGQMAAMLDQFSPMAKLINALTGKTLQQRTNKAVGLDQMGFDPSSYDASPLVQSMSRTAGNLTGDPLNALPMAMAAGQATKRG